MAFVAYMCECACDGGVGVSQMERVETTKSNLLNGRKIKQK